MKQILISLLLLYPLVVSATDKVNTASISLGEGEAASFYLPEPMERHMTWLNVGGRSTSAIVLASNQGKAAFFIGTYLLPSIEGRRLASKEAIADEIARCLANIDGVLVSRRELDGVDYPTVEVIARSPRSNNLRVRCRVICTEHNVVSLTAVTDEGALNSLGVERFFTAFVINKEAINQAPESTARSDGGSS